MANRISILGSTGSIGRQTLDVAEQMGLRVAALTANASAARMEEQVRRFRPALAVLTDEEAASDLAVRLADTDTRVVGGADGLMEAATLPEADTVVTAVVGMVGLRPTLAAIGEKKRIALANKETLVCAGELVMDAAERSGAEIVPVDSEHSAIFQCLQGCRDRREIRRLILTCSGGPFYGMGYEEVGKMTREDCEKALRKSNYFGTMLVKMGVADALLGGATYSTADTVRPALQILKTRPGSKIVSSCFIMNRTGVDGKPERYAMADCAINLHPTADELVEIAVETGKTASFFGIDPKVAMLSYSTLGSGKGEDVDKVREASQKLKAMELPFPVEGEIQFDAAVAPEVGKLKAPGSKVAGEANVFVFPDINAGNIGYKIAQRLGGFEAVGPILQGLAANINDLSRGCNAEEVYKMSIITAGMENG